MTSSSGSPRNTSVYPAASSRSGKSTGERVVRARAMARPRARMRISLMIITRRFSHRPRRTSGSARVAYSQEKNEVCTRSQPGARVTARYSTAATTTVLAAAM